MPSCCSGCRWTRAGRPRPDASASTWHGWPTTRAMPDEAIKRDGTVLGFDVGARRIGVAVGSAFGHHARALAVVDVHASGPARGAIDKLRKEWRPDGLVVGDPMTLDGGDQPIRQRAREFARTLRERYALPVV